MKSLTILDFFISIKKANLFIFVVLAEAVRLPRSGRVIRTLAGAPPTHQRTFTPPQPPNNNEDEPVIPKLISSKHLTAEVCHIMYLSPREKWTEIQVLTFMIFFWLVCV